MLLDNFKKAKEPEIRELRRLERAGLLPVPRQGRRPDFLQALQAPPSDQSLAIIAEFKQASPSRGIIAEGLSPELVAEQYAHAGASCISVLTEEQFFKGELGFLDRMAAPGVPLLRKDFIMDPLQVTATAATAASAMLLIVRFTPDAGLLRTLREQAESFGIHAVVEIFDETDLILARQSGARIIQVNARDLDTLKTDRQICLDLVRFRQDGEIWIAASAMEQPSHLTAAAQAGYHAALIGTALMQNGKPGDNLSSLIANLH